MFLLYLRIYARLSAAAALKHYRTYYQYSADGPCPFIFHYRNDYGGILPDSTSMKAGVSKMKFFGSADFTSIIADWHFKGFLQNWQSAILKEGQLLAGSRRKRLAFLGVMAFYSCAATAAGWRQLRAWPLLKTESTRHFYRKMASVLAAYPSPSFRKMSPQSNFYSLFIGSLTTPCWGFL